MPINTMTIKTTINNFIQYVLGSNQAEQDLSVLITHLDKLALLAGQVTYQFDETDYPESPDNNYAQMRTIVESRFPTLGFYNTCEDVSEKIGETSILVGDAIDDIVDILGDLKEVSWCFDNTSENDALWHFENSYRSHWGWHLRELQGYLHDTWW